MEVLICPKAKEPVKIDEKGICSNSVSCDGILSYDAVEYIKHEGDQIPPELSEFISIIKKGNKCPYKK
jgi:hypothetical protein